MNAKINLEEILNQYDVKPALLLGNGINRYKNNQPISWGQLLNRLATSIGSSPVPQGISFTEFFDVLSISSKEILSKQKKRHVLQKKFCDEINSLVSTKYHRYIVDWAKRYNRPILTTNFDTNLSDAIGARLQRNSKKKFTYYYPFESYFSDAETKVNEPTKEFAIWHINGMKRYPASVRLGLTHYMGSVEKVRPKIQSGARALFNASSMHWVGSDSWLDVFFHCPILLIGISLDENEVFLRWLLIQRAKYFVKYPERYQRAWYVHTKNDEMSEGKRYFLEGVGLSCCEEESFDSIYSKNVWKI